MWNSGVAVTVAMVATACTEVGISTMMKAAMREGLSQFVYTVYSNILGLLILAPTCFVVYRKRSRPQFTRFIVFKIFLMGLLSCGVQTFMNSGIRFSSPTMSAAMTDLTPAFTFLLAVISRMEKLELGLRSSQAKSIGTTVSIIGALIVTFYKGWPLTALPSKNSFLNLPHLFSPSNWALGGILCASGAMCLSMLYVVQTWILRDFPAELIVTCMSCSFVAMLSTIICLIAEPNLNTWILKPDVQMIAVFCSALFAVSIRGVVHTWSCGLKGPLYTAMFNPLGMIIATFLGVTFLGDTLYAGRYIYTCIHIVLSEKNRLPSLIPSSHNDTCALFELGDSDSISKSLYKKNSIKKIKLLGEILEMHPHERLLNLKYKYAHVNFYFVLKYLIY